MTENLPVPYEGAQVPATIPDDGFAESVAFKALDLRVNRSKGHFWLEGESTPRDEVYLIPRGCHRAQQFYGLPYSPKEPHEPSCASPDARTAYGWIDLDDRNDQVRSCIGCPKKGFGAGHCTDLMVMMAYDVESKSPVMLRFQNAELNPRKGQLTLAVNRFRAQGLSPWEVVFKMSFEETGQAYKSLLIDVKSLEEGPDLEDYDDIVAKLDVCWAAYEESRRYEVQDILERQ